MIEVGVRLGAGGTCTCGNPGFSRKAAKLAKSLPARFFFLCLGVLGVLARDTEGK